MRSLALLLFALGCALPGFASAQDVPSRVGRIAWTEGAVSLYRDPAVGWDEAFVNAPITSENSVWTDPDARAEVSVGATVFRLDGATQLDVAHLDYDGIDAQVESGTLAVRVRHQDRGGHLVLATGQARFALMGDGSYRLDVDPDANQARLTVFSGVAQFESAQGLMRIRAGQSVVASGPPSPSYEFGAADSDEFDRWVATRDARWREGPATRYVSTDMTGYEDLDAYGQWSNDAEFGAVWFPTHVPADWVPYRTGHWTWVDPWGWTWVDNEHWGYAPFHYGRWTQVGNRWGWLPPARTERRPVWAPALVAFVGGANWNAGAGTSAAAPLVGWYPLAPWQRYKPWYRANASYVNRVNSAVRERDHPPRALQGQQDWRFANRDRGATVIHRSALLERRPVAQARVPVAPDSIRRQPGAQPTTLLPSRTEAQRAHAAQARPANNAAAARGIERGPTPASAIPLARAAPSPGTPPPRNDATARRKAQPDFARERQKPAPKPAPAAAAPPGIAPASTDASSRPRERREPPSTQQGRPLQPARPSTAPAPQENAAGVAPRRGLEQQQQQREAQQKEAQQKEAQQRAARQQQQSQQREAQQREAQQKQAQQREAQQKEAQQQQSQQREAKQREAKQPEAQQHPQVQQREPQKERAGRPREAPSKDSKDSKDSNDNKDNGKDEKGR